jgi:hypothetical protein
LTKNLIPSSSPLISTLMRTSLLTVLVPCPDWPSRMPLPTYLANMPLPARPSSENQMPTKMAVQHLAAEPTLIHPSSRVSLTHLNCSPSNLWEMQYSKLTLLNLVCGGRMKMYPRTLSPSILKLNNQAVCLATLP